MEEAAGAAVSILRQGVSSVSACAAAPAEVLNDAAEIMWHVAGCSAGSSGNDDSGASDEMTIMPALGSLRICASLAGFLLRLRELRFMHVLVAF